MLTVDKPVAGGSVGGSVSGSEFSQASFATNNTSVDFEYNKHQPQGYQVQAYQPQPSQTMTNQSIPPQMQQAQQYRPYSGYQAYPYQYQQAEEDDDDEEEEEEDDDDEDDDEDDESSEEDSEGEEEQQDQWRQYYQNMYRNSMYMNWMMQMQQMQMMPMMNQMQMMNPMNPMMQMNPMNQMNGQMGQMNQMNGQMSQMNGQMNQGMAQINPMDNRNSLNPMQMQQLQNQINQMQSQNMNHESPVQDNQEETTEQKENVDEEIQEKSQEEKSQEQNQEKSLEDEIANENIKQQEEDREMVLSKTMSKLSSNPLVQKSRTNTIKSNRYPSVPASLLNQISDIEHELEDLRIKRNSINDFAQDSEYDENIDKTIVLDRQASTASSGSYNSIESEASSKFHTKSTVSEPTTIETDSRSRERSTERLKDMKDSLRQSKESSVEAKELPKSQSKPKLPTKDKDPHTPKKKKKTKRKSQMSPGMSPGVHQMSPGVNQMSPGMAANNMNPNYMNSPNYMSPNSSQMNNYNPMMMNMVSPDMNPIMNMPMNMNMNMPMNMNMNMNRNSVNMNRNSMTNMNMGMMSPKPKVDPEINDKIQSFKGLRQVIAQGNKSIEYRYKWVKMLIMATNYKLYAYINIKGEPISDQIPHNKSQFVKSAYQHVLKLVRDMDKCTNDDINSEICLIYANLLKNYYMIYGQDFNVVKDLEGALKYYDLAIKYNPGNSKALYNLGDLYEFDYYDEFDRALNYYKQSAKLGYNKAIYKMALLYLNVPHIRSIKFVKILIDLAAIDVSKSELVDEDEYELKEIVGYANYELGKAYEGIYPGDLNVNDEFITKCLEVIPVNYSKALSYYNKSAKLDCLLGQVKLGKIYEFGELNRQQNANKSIQWYLKAVSHPLSFKRHPDAMIGLSRWCIKGTNGASKHIPNVQPEKAVKWCDRALKEYKTPESFYQMGKLAEMGLSSKPSDYWYQKAESLGYQTPVEAPAEGV